MLAEPDFDPLGSDAHDWHGYYAGFGSRLMGYVVDALAVVIGFYATIGLTSLFVALFTLERPSVAELPDGLYFLFFLLFSWSYFTGLVWLFGRTLGMAIMGLRVVTTKGERVGFWRAWIRSPAYFVSYAFFCLGFFWIVISKTNRAWHDYIARTCVVYDWDARPAARFRLAQERARDLEAGDQIVRRGG